MFEQVIKSYEDLESVLPCDKTTVHSKRTQLKILVFECHCSRGVAHQKLGEYRRAINCFSRAIKVLQVKKDDCSAGCRSGSLLHLLVPVLAKRSLCSLQLGHLNSALADVESALVKDFSNLDLFCIRSLVNFTRSREQYALSDLKYVLKHDRTNLCALILRGYFIAPKKGDGISVALAADHVKACERNPECYSYIRADDIRKDFNPLFQRFLATLRFSHTVSVHDLVTSGALRQSARSSAKRKSSRGCKKVPFLCGTSVKRMDQANIKFDWCTQCPTKLLRSSSLLMCRHCRPANTRNPCRKHVSQYIHPSSAPVQRLNARTRGADEQSAHLQDSRTGYGISSGTQLAVQNDDQTLSIRGDPERMYPKPWLHDKIAVPVPLAFSPCRDLSPEVPPLPQFPSYISQLRRSRQTHR